MYISKKTHILSGVLMKTAVINLAGSGVNSITRTIMNKKVAILFPAMTDDFIWYGQVMISILQIAATAVVFQLAWKQLLRYRGVVDIEDFVEMAKLQEEVNPKGISTLSSYSIGQLLQIWAVILIGVRFVYDLSAVVYRNFVTQISQIAVTASLFGGVSLVEVYNNTHGFKYIGMFIAVMLGTIMTAIFLRDRLLKLICAGVTIFYMLAFVVVNMGSINFFGMSVGIVWTSIIFHISETVGMMGLAVYLSKMYRGL